MRTSCDRAPLTGLGRDRSPEHPQAACRRLRSVSGMSARLTRKGRKSALLSESDLRADPRNRLPAVERQQRGEDNVTILTWAVMLALVAWGRRAL